MFYVLFSRIECVQLFNNPTGYSFIANSVDPVETAHHEPSHQDLHCLLFCFDF